MNREFLEQIWKRAYDVAFKEIAGAIPLDIITVHCPEGRLTDDGRPELELPYLDDAQRVVGFINEMDLRSVAKMQSPLTEEDAAWLLSKYPKSLILDVLCAMENYKGLNRKYKSAKLTANNWCSKRLEDSGGGKNTNIGVV